MAKDDYWFKHDAGAGRGLRLRKIQHIYGHEGKGYYWDVIEVLRSQDGYGFSASEFDIQMLASLIGAKDEEKFANFIKDCIKVDLFYLDDNKLYSKKLIENMQYWETKKANGKKPKLKRKRSEIEAKPHIIEQNRIEDNSTEEMGEYKNPQKGFVPPTVSEVTEYFKSKGYSFEAAIFAYNWYNEADWFDSEGKKVFSWKQKMQKWFTEENKIKPGQQPLKLNKEYRD